MMGNQTSLQEPRPRPDEDLIAAAKNGVPSAMEELLSRYRNQVYSVVRRGTDNREDAEDAVQEAMLRAFVKIGTFRGEARFSSWLITIAINASMSIKRRMRPTQWIYLDDPNGPRGLGHPWIASDTGPTPEQVLLKNECRRRLQRKFLRLPPKYQTVLRAQICDELSIEEIARILKLAPGVVKSRLHHARRKLFDLSNAHSFQPLKTMKAKP